MYILALSNTILTLIADSFIRRSKTPERIVMKFCLLVELIDIVTQAKFGDDRLCRFCMAWSRISGLPIDLGSLPYNTLALPCRSVIEYYLI